MPNLPENFDPYLNWLGIRDSQRPPNHYVLLGVTLFEADPEVLAHAAERQMSHVRKFQAGPRSAESQRLLNEIAAAKICLLQPEKRAAYDAALRERLTQPAPIAMPAAVPATAELPAGGAEGLVGPRVMAAAIGVLALTAVVLTAAIVYKYAGRGRDDSNGDSDRPVAVAPDEPSQPAPAAPEPPPPVSPSPESPSPESPSPESPKPESPKPDLPSPESPSPESPSPDPPKPMPAPQASPPPKPEPEPEPDPFAPSPPENDPETKPKPAAVERPAPPDATALAAAIRTVKELFRDEYAKAVTADDRKHLARVLRQKAVETTDDSAARYALFCEARDEALDAGDVARFQSVLKDLDREYRIDKSAMAASCLQRAVKRARDPKILHEHVAAALAATREAAALDRFESAAALLDTALDTARDIQQKTKDYKQVKDAVALQREVQARQKEFETVRAAEKKLEESPDDPEANLLVGRRCCLRGEWEVGLPMLAKGSDAALRSLAQAEANVPTQATEKLALGDLWWEAASGSSETHRPLMTARAAFWYQQAVEGLTGLTRTRVEKRLAELKGK